VLVSFGYFFDFDMPAVVDLRRARMTAEASRIMKFCPNPVETLHGKTLKKRK
jgi:hypothetical protein